MENLQKSDKLNVLELMEVKGGILDKTQVCILSAAVKCTVQGSGVIIQQPSPSTQTSGTTSRVQG